MLYLLLFCRSACVMYHNLNKGEQIRQTIRCPTTLHSKSTLSIALSRLPVQSELHDLDTQNLLTRALHSQTHQNAVHHPTDLSKLSPNSARKCHRGVSVRHELCRVRLDLAHVKPLSSVLAFHHHARYKWPCNASGTLFNSTSNIADSLRIWERDSRRA